MSTITINMYLTLALAVLALFLGAYLRKRIRVLDTFCIPTPVVGGLVTAIITCVLYSAGIVEFQFDDTLREFFMVFFFTTVGFQADFKMLKRGGRGLIVLLVLVFILIILQNVLALGLAHALDLDPLLAMCTGSIPMVGGHGTAGAFGPILEDFGLRGATTIATAAATFGLIGGSLMGGPLGNSLILRKDLLKTAVQSEAEDLAPASGGAEITIAAEGTGQKQYQHYAEAVLMLCIVVGVGTILSAILTRTGMTFPVYIGSLIMAAIVRNLAELTGKITIWPDEIESIGEISLSLFLGIAMITLKLWQLADLAVPLLILLAAQLILMFLYARFIAFNLMGRDYDAAVITAGVCGFGMGATPNAMANMQAVCDRFVPSHKAYLLVPIVGALFVDFMNSLVITGFINII